MTTVKFCYEIHEDAGLAYDDKTGEDAKAYMSADIELNRELTSEEYKIAHEDEMVERLLQQLNISKEHLKPISVDEFNEKQGE